MLRPLILAALVSVPVLTPAIADAQVAAVGEAPPKRIRSVTLNPGQKCPASSGEEIVVCQTLDQPYRIPKGLRDTEPLKAKNQSWVNRASQIDQASRVAGGLPDTCSAIGTGGQTGCNAAIQQQWAAEQRAKRGEAAAAATTPATTP